MSAETLISVLTWCLVAVGTGLIWCLVWFALRIVSQLDRVEQLIATETADLDKRVTRLEDWKEVVLLQQRNGPKGMP